MTNDHCPWLWSASVIHCLIFSWSGNFVSNPYQQFHISCLSDYTKTLSQYMSNTICQYIGNTICISESWGKSFNSQSFHWLLFVRPFVLAFFVFPSTFYLIFFFRYDINNRATPPWAGACEHLPSRAQSERGSSFSPLRQETRLPNGKIRMP